MSDVSVLHLLIPEPGVTDGLGRRWCALCRLPEDNRTHGLLTTEDPAKQRMFVEIDGE